jgi:hypothetical protein
MTTAASAPFRCTLHFVLSVFAALFMVCLSMTAQSFPSNDDSGNLAPSVSNFESPSTSEPASFAEAPESAPQPSNDWVNRWLGQVDKTRTEQPHYAAPLITTHVLLVQQFRYDIYGQEGSAASWIYNYGAGKGLEIIPNARLEVQVAVPPYIAHQSPSPPDGFGDVSMFIKFRAFSSTEGKGDYFVGLFLGASFPSGAPPNGTGHTVWSPMIAAAKGWGHFDIQSTLSGNIPQSGTAALGRSIVFNDTFQYNIRTRIWPEVELNSTFFVDGPRSGNSEAFLTPGIIFGRFHLGGRLYFIAGTGLQVAVTSFHEYTHRGIASVRFPF